MNFRLLINKIMAEGLFTNARAMFMWQNLLLKVNVTSAGCNYLIVVPLSVGDKHVCNADF